MSKFYYERVTKEVNYDTGEFQEKTTQLKKEEEEKEYVKIYVDTISLLTGLPMSNSPVLLELLKHLTYANDKHIINTNKQVKEEMLKNLGISKGRLNNILTNLCKADIIKRLSNSVFMANPNYIAKGSFKDICKIKKVWIDLEQNKITLKT